MWYSVIVLFVALYTSYSPEQTKILHHLSSAIGNKRGKNSDVPSPYRFERTSSLDFFRFFKF